MKCSFLSLSLFLFSISFVSAQQPFQAEDIIHTIGGHQLKYKHIMAYVDMEMLGEDPALLNDQAHLQELTQECLEEFADEPETFIQEMDQHYQAILMGAGNLSQASQQSSTRLQTADQQNQLNTSPGGQWKQTLSGSVLYYTATQSHADLFVQTTQYMHLCPNGTALFYEQSGGGGGAVTAPRQMQFAGSANWDVVEQGGQAYLKMSMQGATQNFPMGVINQKIRIQGLGTFSIQPGGAKCN